MLFQIIKKMIPTGKLSTKINTYNINLLKKNH
jgi:hypothetical protein